MKKYLAFTRILKPRRKSKHIGFLTHGKSLSERRALSQEIYSKLLELGHSSARKCAHVATGVDPVGGLTVKETLNVLAALGVHVSRAKLYRLAKRAFISARSILLDETGNWEPDIGYSPSAVARLSLQHQSNGVMRFIIKRIRN